MHLCPNTCDFYAYVTRLARRNAAMSNKLLRIRFQGAYGYGDLFYYGFYRFYYVLCRKAKFLKERACRRRSTKAYHRDGSTV